MSELAETQLSEEQRKLVRDNDYLFVEIAAQRCLQLMRGAKPKVEVPAHKFTTVAIEEVRRHLVPWELGPDAQELEDEEDAGSSKAD